MTLAPAAPSFSTRRPGTVVLRNISWRTYQSLLAEVGDEPVHLTYDQGLLEIELPSERHEQLKAAVRGLVEHALRAFRTRFEPLGSTTWDRADLLKGIDADECYYVQNEAAVRGRRPIDLAVSPPPDLALEIEVSLSAVDKLAIYGALGVPEVWRVREDGTTLVLVRGGNGAYVPADLSRAIPLLPPSVVTGLLRRLEPAGTLSYFDGLTEFDGWLSTVRDART